MVEFHSTIDHDFRTWESFIRAYEPPIRAAFGSLRFVDPDEVDDLTQDFLLRQIASGPNPARPDLDRGRFRHWLLRCVRNHAIDAAKKRGRRRDRGRPDDFAVLAPIDPAAPIDEQSWNTDVLYALSLLNLALRQVREHWERREKPEVWAVFEELVLAPLIPGRVPLTRQQLRELYPDRGENLDNCCTSVKRVIRRVLPSLIPPGMTDEREPEDRFREWLGILRDAKDTMCHSLHHAFATARPADDGMSGDSSVAFVRGEDGADAMIEPDAESDAPSEFRDAENWILLGIWLETPVRYYIDPAKYPEARGDAVSTTTLIGLVQLATKGATGPDRAAAARVLQLVKSFAKRVHHAVVPQDGGIADEPADRRRRAHNMTPEVAQALYNLAWVLALLLCDQHIVSLGPEQLAKNLDWLLSRSWLDDRLRPVLRQARGRLI